MTLLSVPVTEEDFNFLQTWASKQGTTVESLLAEHAHTLRLQLQQPIHPAVLAAAGVIEQSADGKAEHLDHLAQKHA
jgi:uncharacterized protein involved in type VI secretion and phage assembly